MIDFTRSASSDDPPPVPLNMLTTRQRAVLEIIDTFETATGEACPSTYLARRLHVHHSTIQDHLSSLHRKGWLRTPNAPARLRVK